VINPDSERYVDAVQNAAVFPAKACGTDQAFGNCVRTSEDLRAEAFWNGRLSGMVELAHRRMLHSFSTQSLQPSTARRLCWWFASKPPDRIAALLVVCQQTAGQDRRLCWWFASKPPLSRARAVS